jgi:hypothetical protein
VGNIRSGKRLEWHQRHLLYRCRNLGNLRIVWNLLYGSRKLWNVRQRGIAWHFGNFGDVWFCGFAWHFGNFGLSRFSWDLRDKWKRG